MSQLMDHLTKQSVEALYKAFQNGLIEVIDQGGEAPGIHKSNFDEVGPALLVYVHSKLMEEAIHLPNKAPNKAFPFKAKPHIRSMLMAEGASAGVADRLSGEISRMLILNGMAMRSGHGGHIWLRPGPWPSTLRYVSALEWSKRDDWRTEKRIAEEAAKPQPIVVHHDLRQIKLPDANPESVMEFIARFVTAALKVEQELVMAKGRVLELENQVAELSSELEAKAKDNGAWVGVTEKLAEVMASVPHGTDEGDAK